MSQSSESLGVLTLIFPSATVVQGWTTACDWLEAPLLGHSPCHRFIESCPQGVLRTIRIVIQPESSGCGFPFLLHFPFCRPLYIITNRVQIFCETLVIGLSSKPYTYHRGTFSTSEGDHLLWPVLSVQSPPCICCMYMLYVLFAFPVVSNAFWRLRHTDEGCSDSRKLCKCCQTLSCGIQL